jgi:hypothetical protein
MTPSRANNDHDLTLHTQPHETCSLVPGCRNSDAIFASLDLLLTLGALSGYEVKTDRVHRERSKGSLFLATQQRGNRGYQLDLHFPGAPDGSSVS